MHVTNDALLRGFTQPGETCEIEGIGPIPVSVAREFLTSDDPFITVLLTDGTDVHRVARPGRSMTATLRAALDTRDPTCTATGCNARHRLETHHLVPIRTGNETRLEIIAKLCTHHHDLITNHGWDLQGRPGHWELIPPPDHQLLLDTG